MRRCALAIRSRLRHVLGTASESGNVIAIQEQVRRIGPTDASLTMRLHAQSQDEALEALARLAPRQAKVVELRYFGGLSEEEAADVLKITPRTVRRDWQFAKAWLTRDLAGAG